MKLVHLFCCFCLTLLLSIPLAAFPAVNPDSVQEDPSHNNLFLAQGPIIEVLQDGWIEVSCETLEPCMGGEAFLGIFPQAAQLKYPIYDAIGQVMRRDSLHILARCDLKALETPKNDVNNLKGQRGGQVAIRLQLYGQDTHLIDRSFAYGRSPGGQYRRVVALVEGPFVDCVSDSGAVISFDFDQAAACSLRIKPGKIAYSQAAATHHEILLTGLEADSAYRYAILWADGQAAFASANYEFRTASRRGSRQPFRCAVLCDSRGAYGGAETYVEGVNYAVLKPLLNIAYAQKAAFILFPGDLISGSSCSPAEIEEQFRSWKRLAAPVGSQIPIYEGVGNHDQPALWLKDGSERDYIARAGQEAGEVLFARHFVNPVHAPDPSQADFPPYQETVYSFDWGSAHFAMLNSNYFQKGSGEKVSQLAGQLQGAIRPEQLDWLEADLKAAREGRQEHLFVLAHEPAFPNGGHVQDGMWWNGKRLEIIAIRDRFWKMLCKYRVSAAFFGDEHNYSRTLIDSTIHPAFEYPVWQIITGGAGAPFYARDTTVPWAHAVKAFYPLPHLCLLDVDGENVWLTVMSEEGLVVERVNLSLAQR